MECIDIRSKSRIEFINITKTIKSVIKEKNWDDGIVIAFIPHTTAGITINEGADADVAHDIVKTINYLIPLEWNYAHIEGNSAAHIKASLMGNSVTIIVEKGEAVMGTWQAIFFAEFDGPRHRNIYLKFVKNHN